MMHKWLKRGTRWDRTWPFRKENRDSWSETEKEWQRVCKHTLTYTHLHLDTHTHTNRERARQKWAESLKLEQNKLDGKKNKKIGPVCTVQFVWVTAVRDYNRRKYHIQNTDVRLVKESRSDGTMFDNLLPAEDFKLIYNFVVKLSKDTVCMYIASGQSLHTCHHPRAIWSETCLLGQLFKRYPPLLLDATNACYEDIVELFLLNDPVIRFPANFQQARSSLQLPPMWEVNTAMTVFQLMVDT